jgi:hypothetical protein
MSSEDHRFMHSPIGLRFNQWTGERTTTTTTVRRGVQRGGTRQTLQTIRCRQSETLQDE